MISVSPDENKNVKSWCDSLNPKNLFGVCQILSTPFGIGFPTCSGTLSMIDVEVASFRVLAFICPHECRACDGHGYRDRTSRHHRAFIWKEDLHPGFGKHG